MRLAQPDVNEHITILDGTAEQDEAVEKLALSSGLHVHAARHRAQKGALLLVCLSRGRVPFDENANAEVIGFVSARALFEEAEIFDLCVRETERRRGVGRALVESLMKRLLAENVAQVFLEVRKSNHAAQALYEGLGFSRVFERARYYSDGEDAVLFRCCLAAAP